MNEIKICPIGKIVNGSEIKIVLDQKYAEALKGLDLKPYTPSIDRVENPKTPDWCSHWPKSYEESESFDWGAEFNF